MSTLTSGPGSELGNNNQSKDKTTNEGASRQCGIHGLTYVVGQVRYG